MKLDPSAWKYVNDDGGWLSFDSTDEMGDSGGFITPLFTLPSVLAALREHFKTKYVVGDEIYSEIDAFEKENKHET